ncbi:MAG: hypothetical protein ACK5II_09795 [Paracoccus sp. (in: a-proteobacteria)]
MSELHATATHTSSPEIGDVLASIRRLIAQEGSGLDFAEPARCRADGAGRPCSTLPLGPGGERIRSIIENELNAIDSAGNRLVLRDDGYSAKVRTIAANAVNSSAELPGSGLTVSGQAAIGPDTAISDIAFDEQNYQQAIRTVSGRDGLYSAHVTAITPHLDAVKRPAETTQEITDMMLAEIDRADIEGATAPLSGESFDLFATDAADEEDQLSGGNALRNLVRDVIRQELQGEMGERISRNLRRAIRQEVTAAIAAGLKTV